MLSFLIGFIVIFYSAGSSSATASKHKDVLTSTSERQGKIEAFVSLLLV